MKVKRIYKGVLPVAVFLLFLATNVYGQERRVTGKVTDEQGGPVIGATVVVKGTQAEGLRGTVTDATGSFRLQVPQGRDTLKISFTGYQTRFISIAEKNRVEVQLQPAVDQLDEVVVTALGIKREEKALGYSVQEVKGDDMENSADRASPLKALSGKVPGLNVTSSGNGPGSSVNVLIRGMNSITGSNDPLFVIDGVPIDNSGGSSGTAYGGFDYGNAANNINPDDIESISVLKGGAASALYGYRGSNGVIMITTKQGENDKGLGIRLKSSVSVEMPLIAPDFQNSYSQGSSGEFEPTSHRSWGAKMTGQTVTNFMNREQTLNPQNTHPYDKFYDPGITYDNSLSINKRGEKNGIYFSANWMKSNGIHPHNKFDKKNLTLRYDSKLSEFLKFDAKANYINQQVDNRPNLSGSPDNPVYLMTLMPRSVSLDQLEQFHTLDGYPVVWTSQYSRNPDGTVKWRNEPPAFASSPLLQNPYWAVNRNQNEDARNRLIGFGEFNLDFKEWLGLGFGMNLKARVGMDYYTDLRKRYTAHNTYYKADGLATINESKTEMMELNYTLMLNMRRDFGSFTADASLGANLRNRRNRGIYTSSESGLINEDGPYVIQNFNNPITNDGMSQRQVQSLYGLFNIDYKDMIYLDVTLRNDWSSNLSPENWSYLYPSVSLSWLLHETFELPEVINFAKIRGSWAEVGSGGNLSSFRYYQYGTNSNQFHGLPYGSIPGNRPNKDIHAEFTVSKEVGVKTILFKNRLNLDITYYQTGTRDQILNSPLPPSSGFNSGYINAGFINNTGLEFQADLKLIQTEDLVWRIGGNLTRQWSKIEELAPEQDLQVIGGAAGVVTAARIGEPVGIMLGSAFERNEDGSYILDQESLPKIKTTEDGAIDYEQTIGNSFPNFLWGANTRFSWKNLYMDMSVDSKLGHNIFSLTNMRGAAYGTLAYTTEGRDEWEKAKEISEITGTPPNNGYMVHGIKEGKEGDYPVDPQKYWDRMSRIQEAFVYDASYIRLKNISIGYNLSGADLASLPIQKLSVAVYAANVMYLMRHTENISPESSFGTGNSTGIEMFAQPELRNIGMQLQFSF